MIFRWELEPFLREIVPRLPPRASETSWEIEFYSFLRWSYGVEWGSIAEMVCYTCTRKQLALRFTWRPGGHKVEVVSTNFLSAVSFEPFVNAGSWQRMLPLAQLLSTLYSTMNTRCLVTMGNTALPISRWRTMIGSIAMFGDGQRYPPRKKSK